MGFSISHNLLYGYGVKINDRYIRLARRTLRIGDLAFRCAPAKPGFERS